MNTTCKRCGSDSTLMRFRHPDEDEPPVAHWQFSCLVCGNTVSGSFTLATKREEVTTLIATQFNVP